MSFFSLLILLSLILIVPIFFVIKEKSKQSQLDSTQRHQEYLASASQQLAMQEQQSVADEKVDTFNSIQFSSHHPFVKLLYNANVPESFRIVIDDIGQQYERTHHEQITNSQLFTLNKLVETRIPELVNDYLSLDQNYAKMVIIDADNKNTSFDIVLEQLHSILDFAQKLNTQSQSGVVDKLLASRTYLDGVYEDSGMTNDSLNIK